MSEDPRRNHGPVDQAGTPQPLPPPWLIASFVVLGLLTLAAVVWAAFG